MGAAAKTPRRSLILPVENQVRELDAKLLLACVAAERGFEVILGSRDRIHRRVAFLPRSVYLAKSLAPSSVRMLGILHQLGHRVVAWSEDGLVHAPPESYYGRRLSGEALRRVSTVLAWGQDFADLVRGFPEYEDTPVEITGNPRIDLLRPECRPFFEEEAARLRLEHGPYFLISSSFSHLNHFSPRLGSERILLERAGEIDPNDFSAGRAAHRSELFGWFQKLVPSLATAFPEHRIVVRPHPVEDPAAWKAAAAGYENVEVRMEGNVVPWLIGASALVHNGCTTGVEAFLLRVPAVAYQPVVNARFDTELPNTLSHAASDFGELCRLLRRVLDGRLGPADELRQWERLRHHVAAFEGPLASDRIADVLMDAQEALGARPPAALRARGWLEANRRAASKMVSANLPGSRKSARYRRHRFPGLPVDEIQRRIHGLRDALGRFAGVQARSHSPDVFRIAR